MRVHSSKRVVFLAAAIALGMTACASGGGGAARPAGATSNRIVLEELQALTEMTGLQVIERLRPRWLQSRAGTGGEPPVLYVDGARRGSINDLTSMRSSNLQQLEYMSASDATTRYGTGHGGGAVMVTSRR